MSQSCGEMGYAEGGVINGTNIINSSITGSKVESSELVSSDVKDLRSIDSASAKKIADSIAALPPDQLVALADAILKHMQVSTITEDPTATKGSSVSTTIIGDRNYTLGKPQKWIEAAGGLVPVFNK